MKKNAIPNGIFFYPGITQKQRKWNKPEQGDKTHVYDGKQKRCNVDSLIFIGNF